MFELETLSRDASRAMTLARRRDTGEQRWISDLSVIVSGSLHAAWVRGDGVASFDGAVTRDLSGRAVVTAREPGE